MNHAFRVDVVESVKHLTDDDSSLELTHHLPLIEKRPQVASSGQFRKSKPVSISASIETGKLEDDIQRVRRNYGVNIAQNIWLLHRQPQ